jgi:signal transduction histidine kinase
MTSDTNQTDVQEVALHDIIIEILSSFIDLPSDRIDDEINASLARIGTFVGADRAYVFSLNFQRQTASNTHEWCAPGVQPEIEHLQETPWSMVTEWIETIMRGDPMHLPDVPAMPPSGLRDVLYPQGIQSLLALPLINNQATIGFVGFDWVRGYHACTEAEFKILNVFAQMLSNITTRVHTEEERDVYRDPLLQTAKMDALGRMAGGFAHDFGNVLSLIAGFTRQAQRHLEAGKDVAADLQGIQDATTRASDLTHRLMAVARRQKTEPAVLDVNNEIDRSRDILQVLVGKAIALDWRPGEALHPVRMDPAQLSQILTNLCANARDAIDGNGRVEIETANWTETGPDYSDTLDRRPGTYVRLTIRDTGHGMEQETIDRIFEPFFTTKSADKGTGLGMAIVFGIVQQNHGFLDVQSTPGQGTSISIYLPTHTR